MCVKKSCVYEAQTKGTKCWALQVCAGGCQGLRSPLWRWLPDSSNDRLQRVKMCVCVCYSVRYRLQQRGKRERVALSTMHRISGSAAQARTIRPMTSGRVSTCRGRRGKFYESWDRRSEQNMGSSIRWRKGVKFRLSFNLAGRVKYRGLSGCL